MSENNNENHLKKSLSMMTMIAIAAGAVIGGWLAERRDRTGAAGE